MKLPFTPPNDGCVHGYCIACGHEDSAATIPGNYTCSACRKTHSRTLIIDPAINWWTGRDGEYWHEAAGVFVSNPRREFLFFERTRYPYGITVAAGHVDRGEKPNKTAIRELFEETGVRVQRVTHIATDDIFGDGCRRGADVHRWHCFASKIDGNHKVTLGEEGINPMWLTLEEAQRRHLTFVVREMISRRSKAILDAVSR